MLTTDRPFACRISAIFMVPASVLRGYAPHYLRAVVTGRRRVQHGPRLRLFTSEAGGYGLDASRALHLPAGTGVPSESWPGPEGTLRTAATRRTACALCRG